VKSTGLKRSIVDVEHHIEFLNPLKDRISETEYVDYFSRISTAVPGVATIHVQTPHILTVTKGTWKKCGVGHYYCIPPVCGAGPAVDGSCPDCWNSP
jgi:hypothetical protein